MFEPDFANRWWVADDGGEIWMHSGTAAIARAVPETRTLTLHYRQAFNSPALLHLWAENGDFVADVAGVSGTDGWTTYTSALYTQLPYGCKFRNPGLSDEWEHEEAKRTDVRLTDDTEWWTLEGDRALFSAAPSPDLQLDLTISSTALSGVQSPFFAHVWVNRARGPLASNVPVDSQGRVSLQVYPDVTTSIKFHGAHGHWEHNRHAIQVSAADAPLHRFVVLERPPLLAANPPADLVADPPFKSAVPAPMRKAGNCGLWCTRHMRPMSL